MSIGSGSPSSYFVDFSGTGKKQKRWDAATKAKEERTAAVEIHKFDTTKDDYRDALRTIKAEKKAALRALKIPKAERIARRNEHQSILSERTSVPAPLPRQQQRLSWTPLQGNDPLGALDRERRSPSPHGENSRSSSPPGFPLPGPDRDLDGNKIERPGSRSSVYSANSEGVQSINSDGFTPVSNLEDFLVIGKSDTQAPPTQIKPDPVTSKDLPWLERLSAQFFPPPPSTSHTPTSTGEELSNISKQTFSYPPKPKGPAILYVPPADEGIK